MATTATRGAIHLFVGKIASRVIGMLLGVLLIRILKPEGYGILGVAVIIPEIFALFYNLGINESIVKFFAEYRSKHEESRLRSLFYSALVFNIAVSLGLMVTCLLTADSLVTIVIGKQDLVPLVRAAALLILGWGLFSFSESLFIGLDATGSYAFLMVFYESAVKMIPISLILLGGVEISTVLYGMATATIISGAIGILVSLRIIRSRIRSQVTPSGTHLTIRKSLRDMISYGIPMGISGLIKRGVGRYYGLMIAIFCTYSAIGSYYASQKFLGVITFLTFPVSAVLFPMFSKIDHGHEPKLLTKVLNYSIFYSSIIILPFVLLLLILARPLLIVVLGPEFEAAWIFLTLLSIEQLVYGLGEVHLRRLLNSQAETRFVAKLQTLSAIIGIGLGAILIPTLGIIGLIFTILISIWPAYFLSVRKASLKFKIRLPFKKLARLYSSVGIMAAFLLIVLFLPINNFLKLVVGSLAGLSIYLLALVITRSLEREDLEAFRKMTSAIPLINRLAERVLIVIEYLVAWNNRTLK